MLGDYKSKYNEETIQRVIELKLQGKTHKQVAEEVFGSQSKQSTVGDLYRAYLEYEQESSEGDEQEQVPVEIQDEDNLEELCKSDDADVANLAKRLRTAQFYNNQLRRLHRDVVDNTAHFDDMIESVKRATQRINSTQVIKTSKDRESDSSKEFATMEILFSDLQIGKVAQHYNTSIAKNAMKEYGQQIMKTYNSFSKKYNVEKIVFASLGDIVEDHLKHGVQSATSTDTGLAEQMANAIELIWKEVLLPLSDIGVPVEVICVAGNHGSSQHKGIDMYKAGLYSYDYTIYKSLQGYCEALGLDHVVFNLPQGVFAHTSVYGRTAIYEHGYFNKSSEKSMEDQMKKRGQQIKRHADYFRCGDMHHVCSYDNHKMVLNGAFFGTDSEGIEYSGILGFNSTPAQVIMLHVDEQKETRSSIKEFVTIQVGN